MAVPFSKRTNAHSMGGMLAQSSEVISTLIDGDETPIAQGEVSYVNTGAKFLKGFINKRDNPKSTKTDAGGDIIENWDVAQSHFFTVQISQLIDKKGNTFSFASGRGTYKDYVPIKSMNLTYTSYDNMSVPFGIFGDLPLLHKKKVSTISFSCYDIDQDVIEMAVRAWENRCFPEGRYVAYLDDIKALFSYRSYDVKGKLNFEKRFYVIPASSVSVSRSYEENSAKMINFSLAVVGMPSASANSGDGLRIAEYGYGEGYEGAVDLYYERTPFVSGYQTNY